MLKIAPTQSEERIIAGICFCALFFCLLSVSPASAQLSDSDIIWSGDIESVEGIASDPSANDIRVLYVHGISCQDPNYSADFQKTVAKKAGFKQHRTDHGEESRLRVTGADVPYFDFLVYRSDRWITIRQTEPENQPDSKESYGFDRCKNDQWYDSGGVIVRRFVDRANSDNIRWLTFYEVLWSPYSERQKARVLNYDLANPRECFAPSWQIMNLPEEQTVFRDLLWLDEGKNGCDVRYFNENTSMVEIAVNRTLSSRLVKHDIINSKISDAVFYMGDGGETITAIISSALCILLQDDPFSESERPVIRDEEFCAVLNRPFNLQNEPLIYSGSIQRMVEALEGVDGVLNDLPKNVPDIFIITESLGSRATFAALFELLNVADGNPFVNFLIARIIGEVKTFYMFANQAPLFEMAEDPSYGLLLRDRIVGYNSRDDLAVDLLTVSAKPDSKEIFEERDNSGCNPEKNSKLINPDTHYGIFFINYLEECLGAKSFIKLLFPDQSGRSFDWGTDWADGFINVCFATLDNTMFMGDQSFKTMFENADLREGIVERIVATRDLYKSQFMWRQNTRIFENFRRIERKAELGRVSRDLIRTYSTENVETYYSIEPIEDRYYFIRTLEDEILSAERLDILYEQIEVLTASGRKIFIYDELVKKSALEASGLHAFSGCYPGRQILEVLRGAFRAERYREEGLTLDRPTAVVSEFLTADLLSLLELTLSGISENAGVEKFRRLTHLVALDRRAMLLDEYKDLFIEIYNGSQRRRFAEFQAKLKTIRDSEDALYSIVAINDDDDVLSYRLPTYFRTKYNVFNYVNVEREYGFRGLGIGDLNQHHIGHKTDRAVQDMFICGLDKSEIRNLDYCLEK